VTTIRPVDKGSRYWFTRHSKSIIFLIIMLAVVGVYEAFSLPIAVFPTTNFPRIIVGVDTDCILWTWNIWRKRSCLAVV